MYFYGKAGDVIPFGFGSNDTSGSGDDGATPVAVVMRDGAADNAAPVHEPTPALLSHVNVPAGAYRLLITASVGNGFANGESYLVYSSLAVDAQNPTGFLGGFSLSANSGIALRGANDDTLKTLSDQADLQATLAICSEARLSELDAANLPADIDSIITLVAALNDISAADVWSSVTRTLTAGTRDSEIDAIKAVTDFLVVKKNIAKNNFTFPMVLTSDHVSDADSLTVTCQRSIDGGVFGNCTISTATFISDGTYKVNLSADDLNGDVIMLKFTAPTADTRKMLVLTVP